MPEPVVHHSPAWLLSGIGNTPGILGLTGTRLSFLSDEGTVFDAPLDSITDITFPWYYFSGGFTATVNGIKRKVSLTRPNGAPRPSASLAGALGRSLGGDLVSAASSLHDVGAGRAAGKAWRELLTGSAAASGAARPGRLTSPDDIGPAGGVRP